MNLFETISKIQPKLPGWCCPEKAEALAAMVVAIRPMISVEIGVFGGSSFIPIALAHKHINYGIVVGIDPWDKSESIKNETAENAAWWQDQDHDLIYYQFAARLKELELEKFTTIWRQTSDRAQPPNVIDLLHIDGSHTDQAVRDVVRYASKVRPGGFCVMDDLDWKTGGVRRAESRLLQMHYTLLYALGTGAAYQRV